MMKYTASRNKKIKLRSAAWYIFILAIAAKLIFIYGSQHPAKHDLLTVNGLSRRFASAAMASRLHCASNLTEGSTAIHPISERSGRAWRA